VKKPAYYLAVFGKPEPPDKDTVDSGRYPLGIRGSDTPGDRGDILLLYCTAGNAENSMSAPGIGIVLTKNKESIFFRYLPFSSPVSKEKIDETFTAEDREKITGMGVNTYWVFDISPESFGNATRGVSIDWP